MDSSPRNKKLMVSNADKTKTSSLFSIRVHRRLSAASYVLAFFRNLVSMRIPVNRGNRMLTHGGSERT